MTVATTAGSDHGQLATLDNRAQRPGTHVQILGSFGQSQQSLPLRILLSNQLAQSDEYLVQLVEHRVWLRFRHETVTACLERASLLGLQGRLGCTIQSTRHTFLEIRNLRRTVRQAADVSVKHSMARVPSSTSRPGRCFIESQALPMEQPKSLPITAEAPVQQRHVPRESCWS